MTPLYLHKSQVISVSVVEVKRIFLNIELNSFFICWYKSISSTNKYGFLTASIFVRFARKRLNLIIIPSFQYSGYSQRQENWLITTIANVKNSYVKPQSWISITRENIIPEWYRQQLNKLKGLLKKRAEYVTDTRQ